MHLEFAQINTQVSIAARVSPFSTRDGQDHLFFTIYDGEKKSSIILVVDIVVDCAAFRFMTRRY